MGTTLLPAEVAAGNVLARAPKVTKGLLAGTAAAAGAPMTAGAAEGLESAAGTAGATAVVGAAPNMDVKPPCCCCCCCGEGAALSTGAGSSPSSKDTQPDMATSSWPVTSGGLSVRH